MVRFLLGSFLMLLPLVGSAEPRLYLQLEQDKQQLGRAFNVRLIATDLNKNLSNIDLSPLEKNFGVLVKEYSSASAITTGADTTSQQLALQLYPRQTGRLQLPALFFSGTSSRPQEVNVLPASNTSGPINIEYQLSTTQPWQRQQVLLSLQVTTPDRFARLETVDSQHNDHEIKHIPTTKETLSGTTRLESGWVIFPARSGPQTISLPPVLYHLQGAVERRFYLPNTRLNVKALPGYIPPLMPVGKVFIDSHIDADKLLNTDETYNWNIRLHSPELLAHLLPPLLRQINSNHNIHFLSAQSRRKENISNQGSYAEVVHTIPFQVLSTGQVKLPPLRIQYFDPVQGRVASSEYIPSRTWGMASYWQILILAVFLFAGALPVKATWKYGASLRRRHEYNKKAIHHISTATTARQLRQALDYIARAEGWPRNLSIINWRQHWNSRYFPSSTLTMEKLSMACYSSSETDTIKIRDDMLELINDRRSICRRFYVIRD